MTRFSPPTPPRLFESWGGGGVNAVGCGMPSTFFATKTEQGNPDYRSSPTHPLVSLKSRVGLTTDALPPLPSPIFKATHLPVCHHLFPIQKNDFPFHLCIPSHLISSSPPSPTSIKLHSLTLIIPNFHPSKSRNGPRETYSQSDQHGKYNFCRCPRRFLLLGR